MFVSPAYAQAAGAPAPGFDFVAFLPFILIFVIMYFLIIRPQQKKMKEHQAMLAALRRGDEVVTAGGIHGKISKVKEGEDEIELELSKDIRVVVDLGSVSRVKAKTEPAAVKK